MVSFILCNVRDPAVKISRPKYHCRQKGNIKYSMIAKKCTAIANHWSRARWCAWPESKEHVHICLIDMQSLIWPAWVISLPNLPNSAHLSMVRGKKCFTIRDCPKWCTYFFRAILFLRIRQIGRWGSDASCNFWSCESYYRRQNIQNICIVGRGKKLY